MSASEVALPLRIGPRTIGKLRRRLVRRGLTLDEALAGTLPELPALGPSDHGYFITSLPASLLEEMRSAHPALRLFVRQRYARSYADLGQSFEDWLSALSGKSRSTLKRKVRKLAERCGGTLDVRCYRTAAEMEAFYRDARTISARTYQERLLGAGLPEGPEALMEIRRLAAQSRARAWLLFVEGRPASYLYAPAQGTTLLYAFVGYDPDFAELSPGAVLQFEAFRDLMEERCFSLFDFTEGDGQHKRQFASGSVECVDLLLVRPTLTNVAVGYAVNGFDSAVGLAKRLNGLIR